MIIKHKKAICLTAIAMFLSLVVAKGQTKLSGVYVDSLTQEPIPYATVAIYKSTAHDPEQVSITDMDGKFSVKTRGKGQYRLVITNIGNKQYEKNFNANVSTLDLGTILALSNFEKLEDVTVVAQKPIIKAEVDRITYSVEDDPDAEAKTALDMLRKMPLITVEGDDEIKLNGSTDFEIQVNGRPSTMFESEPGKTLKSMPATAIKNVQVITSPGARYDAEGVGGIINITMAQGTSMDGYTVTVTLNGQMPKGIGAGINAMIKKNRLTMSGRGFFSKRQSADTDFENIFEYAPFDGKNKATTTSTTYSKNQFIMGNIDMSLEIDSLRLLTASYNSRNGFSEQFNFGAMSNQVTNGETLYSITSDQYSKNNWGGHEFNINYERKLNENNIFTFSYKFFFTPKGGGDGYLNYYNCVGTLPRTAVNNTSDNEVNRTNHVGQIDFESTINEHNSVEVGVKYIARHNESESENVYLRSLSEYFSNMPDSIVDNNLAYDQNVLSGYASYTLKLGNFSAKLGARVENTMLDVDNSEIINSVKNPIKFDYNETDVVPSVFTSYNLTSSQTIKASYNMRIRRPGIRYLNPHRNENSPYEVSYGNINLDSEHYHNFSLSYSYFGQRVMINTGINYRYCNNSIENYRFLNEDNVLESTYLNHGERNRLGFSIYGNFTVTQSTRIWLNTNLDYIHIVSKLNNQKAEGFSPRIFGGIQQELPAKIHMGLFGGFSGKQVQMQYEQKSMYFYGLDLNRSFIKDRLTISMSANNFLTPTLDYSTTQMSDAARSISNMKNQMWSVRMGVSFKIGDLKASVKKIRSDDSDDDMMGGGGNGMGSMPDNSNNSANESDKNDTKKESDNNSNSEADAETEPEDAK